MTQRPDQRRRFIPTSVGVSYAIIALAFVGGVITIVATRNTKVSEEAITTLAAAVIGVAGVHIGHVTGHQREKQWQWLSGPASLWIGFVIIALALVGGFCTIGVVAFTKVSLSAEAIASLAAAIVGVAGTHIGHVTGHQLGKEQLVEADVESGKPE